MRAAIALRRLARAPAAARARWSAPPWLRRVAHAVAAVVGATALALAGYLLWFRDSSLVRVEQVSVSGLTTRDAPRVRDALVTAAREMTTLHVRVDRLERAVSASPVVESVRATPDFPHSLRITVVERRPVAGVAVRGRGEVAVAPDGTLLPAVEPGDRLAELPPGGAAGGRLRDPRALDALRVVTAAPAPLASHIEQVDRDGRELVASLRDGPRLAFGDLARLDAKWAAAASVLAHPAIADSGHVDLRVPERPVVERPTATAPTPEPAAPRATAPALANPQP